jgi:hypothetical protein
VQGLWWVFVTLRVGKLRISVIPVGAGPCQGAVLRSCGGVRACVTGVSCFPDSRVRGGRLGGSRTGRSPAAVAAPEASLRRPAGGPMIRRRGTGARAVPGVSGCSGASPWSGVIPVRAVPLPAVIPSRVPGRGQGAWGGPRQNRRSSQAGRMPSWHRSYECYALSPVAAGCRWLLPLLSAAIRERGGRA